MSLRAELRRRQRESAKEAKSPIMGFGQIGTLKDLAEHYGMTVDDLMAWKEKERQIIWKEANDKLGEEYQKRYSEAVDDLNKVVMRNADLLREAYELQLNAETAEIRKIAVTECIRDFNDRLYEAENWICLVNVLISLTSIHKAWGYKAGLKKFIERWDAAKEELNSDGARATLEKVNGYGLDLEFDTFEIEDFIKACGEMDVEGVMKYLDDGKAKAG